MNELKWSITNGDIDQVRKILEESPDSVNATIDGRKPIHYASDFGQTVVIDYLISKGAEVNALDSHGITALLAAIWEGHTSTVKLLLSKGARKDLKAPDNTDYVDCADKPEIKKLLL